MTVENLEDGILYVEDHCSSDDGLPACATPRISSRGIYFPQGDNVLASRQKRQQLMVSGGIIGAAALAVAAMAWYVARSPGMGSRQSLDVVQKQQLIHAGAEQRCGKVDSDVDYIFEGAWRSLVGKVNTSEKCCHLCYAKGKCRAWTWVSNSSKIKGAEPGQCVLKGGNLTHKLPKPGMISALVLAPGERKPKVDEHREEAEKPEKLQEAEESQEAEKPKEKPGDAQKHKDVKKSTVEDNTEMAEKLQIQDKSMAEEKPKAEDKAEEGAKGELKPKDVKRPEKNFKVEDQPKVEEKPKVEKPKVQENTRAEEKPKVEEQAEEKSEEKATVEEKSKEVQKPEVENKTKVEKELEVEEKPEVEKPKVQEKTRAEEKPKVDEKAEEKSEEKSEEKATVEEKSKEVKKPEVEKKTNVEDKPVVEEKPEVEEKPKAQDKTRAEGKPKADEKAEEKSEEKATVEEKPKKVQKPEVEEQIAVKKKPEVEEKPKVQGKTGAEEKPKADDKVEEKATVEEKPNDEKAEEKATVEEMPKVEKELEVEEKPELQEKPEVVEKPKVQKGDSTNMEQPIEEVKEEKAKKEEEEPWNTCPEQKDGGCLTSKCCREPGLQCYAKNEYWAECMESCVPGPNLFDEESNTPWTCKPLGTRAVGEPKKCAEDGENCMEEQCCASSGMQCYGKNGTFGMCKIACTPGVNMDDQEDSEPWSCKAVGARSKAPASWVETKCAKSFGDCSKAKCCTETGMQCYLQNPYYGQCKADCVPAPGMNCSAAAAGPRTPRLASAIAKSKGKVGSWVGKVCSDKWASCLESKCCHEVGATCYAKNATWATCREHCTPGPNPKDGNATWTCKALGPQSWGLALKGYPSLFCFSLYMPSHYEGPLMKSQLEKNVGIFACDGYDVFAAENDTLGTTKDGVTVKAVLIPKINVGTSQDGTAGNAKLFMAVWDKIIAGGRFRNYDWTIKVDPDAVLLPWRLRTHMEPHTGEHVYVVNCNKFPTSPNFPMMYGALEVFSKTAMEAYAAGSWKCGTQLPWKTWGEDYYMTHCLDYLHVGRISDFSVLGDNMCIGANCADKNTASFHPFKTWTTWETCWDTANGHPPPPPPAPAPGAPTW